VSASGVIVISELLGHRVRSIASDGTISTLAGVGSPGSIQSPPRLAHESPLRFPAGVALDGFGNVLLTDAGNFRLALARAVVPCRMECARRSRVGVCAERPIVVSIDGSHRACGRHAILLLLSARLIFENRSCSDHRFDDREDAPKLSKRYAAAVPSARKRHLFPLTFASR